MHPFDNDNEDLVTSPIGIFQTHQDFYGGEQVLSHYQNFGMVRREVIVFWVGYIALIFIKITPNFYFSAKGKKWIAVPIFNRFYRKIAKM